MNLKWIVELVSLFLFYCETKSFCFAPFLHFVTLVANVG